MELHGQDRTAPRRRLGPGDRVHGRGPSARPARRGHDRTVRPERKLAWGFGLALTVLAANALISYRDLAELSANTRHVVHSREILEEVEDVASAFKDAETARRGYLIDGDPADLAAFERAAAPVLARGRAAWPADRRAARPGHAVPRARARPPGPARRAPGGRSTGPGRGRRRRAGRVPRRAGPRGCAGVFDLAQAIEDEEDRSWHDRVAERRASIWRSFVTFSIASTLALILIGSIYALVRRYLAERSTAERTLRESEARVRLLLDSAGEGVYGVDLEGPAPSATPPGSSSWASNRPTRSSAGTCTT